MSVSTCPNPEFEHAAAATSEALHRRGSSRSSWGESFRRQRDELNSIHPSKLLQRVPSDTLSRQISQLSSQGPPSIVGAGGPEEIDHFPPRLRVTWWYLVTNAFCICAYMFDIGSDLVVGVFHFQEGRRIPGALVVSFVFLPSLVVNLTNFAWYVNDERHCEKRLYSTRYWVVIVSSTMLQVSPLLRHISAFAYAVRFRCRQKVDSIAVDFYSRMIEEDRDATLLRLIEAFTESGPQLLIQLYLFAKQYWKFQPIHYVLQGASIFSSFVSLSWSLLSQQRCLRFARLDKANIHIPGGFGIFFWRLGTILCRVVAIVFFALACKWWTVVVLVLHFSLSFVLILSCQRTQLYNGSNFWLESCFQLTIAFVHIFVPFNAVEGNTRIRYLYSYAIELAENLFMLLVPCFMPNFDFPAKIYIVTFALCSWGIGIGCMLLYYGFCHPNGPLFCYDGASECCMRFMDPRHVAGIKMIEQRKGASGGDAVVKNLVVHANEKNGSLRSLAVP